MNMLSMQNMHKYAKDGEEKSVCSICAICKEICKICTHTHPAYRHTLFLYDTNDKYERISKTICRIWTYPILAHKKDKI
jgi:hypothetical protein